MCAIHLARGGLDVTIAEAADELGGAARSGEITLPGFIHDHCAGFNPMTAASPAIQELDLQSEGLRWVQPDVVMAHPFDDGSSIVLHRDVAETAASLELAASGAGEAWRQLLGRYRPLGQQLATAILSPLPPLRAGIGLLGALRGDALLLARRMTGSIKAFGLDLFDGATRPTAWLSGSAQHSGLSPSTAGSGAFGFLLQLLGHSHGWPFPAGGQGESSRRWNGSRGARASTSAAPHR